MCVCVCAHVCPCSTFTPILWSFCDLSPGVRQHDVSTRRPQLRFLCASFSAAVMSVSFPLCLISTLYKAAGCLHSVCHVGYMQGYNYLKKAAKKKICIDVELWLGVCMCRGDAHIVG